MERDLRFEAADVKLVRAGLTWAQMELTSSPAAECRLIVSGDDESVGELTVEHTGGELILRQPRLGYAKEILPRNRWMQISLCIPREWRGDLDINTITGMIGSHETAGENVSLSTVNGRIHARRIEARSLTLHTVAGAMVGEGLRAGRANIRSVSSPITLADAAFGEAKVFTVSGEMTLQLLAGGRALDMQSVSGCACVEVEGPARAFLHSVSGQFLLDESVAQSEGGLFITAASLTGNLAVKRWDRRPAD